MGRSAGDQWVESGTSGDHGTTDSPALGHPELGRFDFECVASSDDLKHAENDAERKSNQGQE